MFKVRNLSWLVPLSILLTLPLWRPLAVNFLQPTGDALSAAEQADKGRASRSFVMEGVIFSQFKKGRREWTIKARSLATKNDENDLHMEKVQAVFWDEKGGTGVAAPVLHMRGDRAKYVRSEQVLTLTDDVIVATDNGYEMQTGLLRFLERDRQFEAVSGVRVAGSNLTVLGETLTYEMDAGRIRVEGKVQAEIY